MDEYNRAFLLGAGGGLGHVSVHQFAAEYLAVGFGGPPVSAVLGTGLVTLLTLAVVPGAVTVAAHRMTVPRSLSRLRLAAAVAAGVATVIVAAGILQASGSVSGLYVTPWSVGSSVVSALAPTVNAGVGALAGLLLADRKR